MILVLIVNKYTGCLHKPTMSRKYCVTNCNDNYDNDSKEKVIHLFLHPYEISVFNNQGKILDFKSFKSNISVAILDFFMLNGNSV